MASARAKGSSTRSARAGPARGRARRPGRGRCGPRGRRAAIRRTARRRM